MSNNNPLSDRGKAAEDKWVKEQERQQAEKAKKDGKAPAAGKDGKGDKKPEVKKGK